MLKELFEKVLKEYKSARNENFSDHPIAHILRNELPGQIREYIHNSDVYKVSGSAGQGNWSYSPWVAILNKEITNSPQKSYYLVYLFREDMKGVYLSLNQGMTEIRSQYSVNETKEILSSKAEKYRKKIGECPELLNSIDLGDINSSNSLFYEAGNIYAVYYDVCNLPSEEKLKSDLIYFLKLYEYLFYDNLKFEKDYTTLFYDNLNLKFKENYDKYLEENWEANNSYLFVYNLLEIWNSLAQKDLLNISKTELDKFKFKNEYDLSKIRIFLSYAKSDRVQVEKLYSFLLNQGFKPWMDIKDIAGGENWKNSINNAIINSEFFIACISNNSLDRRGFIQKEMRLALDKLDEMLDDDIFLIPVRLEECNVPEPLKELQYVSLFKPNGHEKLLNAIYLGLERRKI